MAHAVVLFEHPDGGMEALLFGIEFRFPAALFVCGLVGESGTRQQVALPPAGWAYVIIVIPGVVIFAPAIAAYPYFAPYADPETHQLGRHIKLNSDLAAAAEGIHRVTKNGIAFSEHFRVFRNVNGTMIRQIHVFLRMAVFVTVVDLGF